MKLSILAILMLSSCLCLASDTISDDLRLDLFQYQSIVNKKTIISRPSPKFVKDGGVWKLGQPIKVGLEEIKGKCVNWLKENKKGSWLFHRVSVDKWVGDGDYWVFVVVCASDNGDFATMICNMAGDVWPLGVSYDEFEDSK